MTSRRAPASLWPVVLVLLSIGLFGHSPRATGPFAINVSAQGTATITSDLPDYAPGQTVTLTGHGWTPGETVTIVLHRQPLLRPDTVLTAVADAGGTITHASFAPAPDEDGVTFFVTATGSVSGLQATTTFDARAKRISWVGAVSTDWNTAVNWSSGTVPDNGDELTIPANVPSARYPVVNSTAFAKSITLTAGAGLPPTLTMTGGTLTVSGALELNGGARVIQSGGVIDVIDFDSKAASSTFTQSGGTFGLHQNFANLGVFDSTGGSTGGTIVFAGPGNGANAFNAPGTNQFNHVVVNSGVNTDFSSKADAQILVGGNWTMDGTADLISRNTRVTFNGSGLQTIGGNQQTTFRNLFVDKTAGSTVTLARSALVTNGNVIVVSGTLDLATSTLNRSALGGEIGVVGGAFLKIGGTNTLPSNYAAHTFQPTSTVDYYGTNQTVTAENGPNPPNSSGYGHLILSNTGAKTMPATPTTILGNFTMSGTASATAAANLTVNGNFTLGPGTTFGAASSSHIVRGNFSNSGTFTAGTSTFTFNGTGTQTIGGSNSTTFTSLNIDNAGGVVLSGVSTTVNGTLTFTSGNVTTGPRFIATSATGDVSRTSGHVVGNFQKFVASGAPTLTYEIGDSGAYTPVTVVFGSVTGAGTLTGSTTPSDHPNTGSSPVNRLKSVNRYWAFTNSGLSFTNYSATFNFVAGDLDPAANASAFIVGKFSGGAWAAPTVGLRTSGSTQITDVTSFSDFYIGESAQITTLGTGADPGTTTVAPGGAATMADAFTFQTDGATDTVSAITVTLTPGTAAGLLLLEITDDAGSTVYGAVNPLSDTPSIVLSPGITVTTSSTQYKIRVTPESHAAMPAPIGSSYPLTARVSSWTGSNFNHAGSDSGGTTVTIDNLSPGNVTGATATSGNAQVALAWANPADNDLGTILVLRRAGSAVGDTPAEGATYSVGNPIGSSIVACLVTAPATDCADSGLVNGTIYHYRIFANDTNGNYAIGAVPTGSPVAPNLTTLGNGTDPANATAVPGGAATMADAFTFQTGGGTDAITAVTVTLAPGTSAGLSVVEIINDAGSTDYGVISDPSSDTLTIPLTTPIIATTTSTQYAIRVTPKSHIAMAVPPGASYALTASVSSWTGTNVQAGSDSGGTTVTIDNLSPGNVTGATATGGDQQNTVAWTNPADSDLQQVVVLRRAGAAVASTPTEGVNYFFGDTIGSSTVACIVAAPATSCTDQGLDNGTAYHYKLFARDTNRNYATGVVPTGSPVTPTVTTLGDGTPVSNAAIAPGGAATMADAFTFQTGSGTDTITAITVSLATGTSAAVSLVEITDVAGTIVYGSVSNPSSDGLTVALTTNIIATTTSTQYRIRVTPKSHAAMPAPPGSSYALSVHIDDWTGTNAKDGSDSGNTVITIDNRSPENVTNATATAASTQVLLAWTNPADSDLGTIVVLRRAGAVVGDTPTEGATYSVGNTVGSSTVACVTAPALGCADAGLINGTDYHYKIFAKDIDGNYATGVVPNGSPARPFSRITVTPTSGLTTTEAGGTATFTVVLISRPIADVTIGLSSSDTTEGTVNPSSLTFTSANWDIPQTVTVTGVDDAVDDGDVAYSIVTAPATSAGGYNGQDASDVSVTNTNNDTGGIKVQPATGLSTTEAGGTATFTVVLNTQPTADVTIGLSSSDTTEGTVSPASVTFTSANWSLQQTVTVTGVNDALADGNISYTIVTAAATSGDGKYNGMDPIDVSITNIDNNTVGIIVNPTSGLVTTEAGSTAAFSVSLSSQPTADVTIALSSSDTAEGTINPASLTFTSANWNTPQVVTITGVSDALDDGDIAYAIVTAPATSSDGNYNGVNASDASVTNTDDDTAGVTVSPTSGLTTTEAGGTATFTIVLTSQPTADVTIGLSSSNTAEGTVTPASVMVTPANWNVPQTVTVTGVDGPQVDGNNPYTIVTAPATSTDPNYSGRNAPDVSVTNLDNDTAGITVTPTSGLTTSEAGGTATFTVVLTSQPAAGVTIGLTSNDVNEGTVSPASVTFTSANWNLAQTVTVTGVNNPVDDDDTAYAIVTTPAISTDLDYSGLNASDVSVTNLDDDTAGITVTPTSGLITSEIGGEAPTFTVVLTSRPTANVVINLSSSDTTEGTVTPVSLTFTSDNWNTPRTVTVHGANDVIDDGDILYSIVTVATSGDPKYAAINPDDVTVTNIDSDTAGFFVNPIEGLTTTEAGGRAHFTVVLNTQPSADVTVALSSSDPSEASVSPVSLTFNSDNWNTPQTADVTGLDDLADDGDIAYTIVIAAAISADPAYNGLNPFDVAVINIDNDTSGITVSPTFGLTTTEAVGTATFTIVLTAQPTANVTIGLSSNDTSEGTVNPASVTFTNANWSTPQTVTVTGVNDLFDDGDVAYSIVTAPATSSDGSYNTLNALDVSVSNTDDDAAGITLTPTSGLITTEAGGTATFTVVLTARPTANVTMGLISSDTTEGTVNQAGVTFTSDNWNTAQTVTITGVNDALDDGDIAYDIVTTPAASSDSSYNGLATGNVSVTNADNDAAGIAVTPTFGLTTTEGGGTATFTVVLTSQPTADVTIGLSSSDATEGSVSVSSLTFTAANWNTPRTVTVTGVNDVVDDGDISYAIVTAAATSSDPNYNLFDASNVLVTNADNDATGITVTPSSGLTTTEAGGTATYTIVLTSQPAADVTIALSSTDTTEGTISQSSLTFTPANWSIPQTVTVTGVNDAVDDGDILYNISNAPATSADASYNGLDPIDVAVTNADGDTSGIIVTPITGRITTEGTGTTTFAIVLRSQPTADVTIGLSSNDLTEGTISPASVTFTAANWNTPQTVTVTGVNDDLDDGDIVYRIVTAAAVSADLNYGGFDAIDVLVTNTDDDTAGITVTPTSGLTTTEAGGTATFTVALNAQPTAEVVIGLNSSNTAEGTVGPSLAFTSANWSAPQTVTVTGVNDALDDGDIAYTIVTAAATSADAFYNGINAADVAVTNTDNDAAAITVTPTSGLTTTEAGGTATFTVVLTTQPTADVTIGLSTSDVTEGAVSPASLTFTAANWNTPQTVTISGVNDFLDDGDIAYSIVTAAATSADSGYAGLPVSDVGVTNTDDDSAGVTVSPTSGLTTTEAGGTATFTVVLTSRPTADVMIGLGTSDPTEGAAAPTPLRFTSLNWNTPQTVIVTGADDVLDDGDVAYTIVTTATSADTIYQGIAAADVGVTNTDNDASGITVTPTAGLTTTEAGGTATFTVVVTTQPTADVSVALSSSDGSEGTVSPAGLIFTNGNWNVAQTVTVTGADDALDDGDVAYIILTAAAISADTIYNGFNAADVAVTNTDNDGSGITISPIAGLTTTEAGGTATFTVVLTSQPTASVTIGLSSSNTAEGTVAPASVTFTNLNWNVAQTVTVTGVDDPLDDGNVAYSIVTAAATSGDVIYNGFNANDVAVTNTDNDVSGIAVTPTSGLTTTEAGGTATFTVVLTSKPTADVAIALSSGDATEGTVAPASVTFTSVNWNTAQTVTVTGVEDTLDDGDVAYSIVTEAATSADTIYNGINAADVGVTNTDNDAAGITVTPTAGLTTTEAGGTATFTVVLTTQPTADVTMGLSTSDTTEGTVAPASVTFTSANWNTPRTVTVTGADDVLDDGDVAYTIATAAANSTDVIYNGMNADDVAVTNTDNDAAGIIVTPTSGLTTTEAGGTATFTIALASQPTADVTIAVSSSDTTEGTVSPDSIGFPGVVRFTGVNWNTPVTITVTGVDDALDDGDVAYSIVTAAATSADVTYNGVNASDIAVTNTDNDAVGITVTPTAGLTTTEAGGTATFTVVLNTQPTADVTIALTSGDTTEGTVAPASLVFTPANWNVAQTVTVTGVDDALDDGDVGYTIATAAATSSDVTYNGVNANDVAVTNTDNDAVGITVTPTSGLTTTEAGGTATLTVVLTTQPTADVTIGLSSSDTTEGTVLQASLTFTPANWNVAQTVTVTGVDDALDDGDVAYTIVTVAATSADVTYNGVNASDVAVTNTDNDAVGITVTPTAGLTTTEAGGTATFTVVLATQPTADVTIGVSSSDTTEGTVLPASLTFTAANWNLAQTVTVTGVDDALDDGDVAYTILTAPATSTDVTYSNVNAADVAITNTDNDAVGITVTPTTGLTTTEAGGTATFTVVLTTQPTADVTIGLSSSDLTEGTVLPASLIFTAANWNVAQTMTVTGVDDALDDGDVAYSIVTAAATSADVTYNGVNASDIAVTNTDNDAVGITVTPTAGLTTTEAGGTATFTVVLNTQPTADVTIALTSGDTTEGTVAPASVVFTPANWNVAQTVTVTGVDDALDDGDVAYTILTAAATSSDVTYNGVNANDVAVTNTDNDAVGITVTPISGPTTEAGGTATFTVLLTTQPTADVTIGLSSSDTTEGTVLQASLTFTAANWNVPQTVTVTGVDDALDDGDVAYTILTAAATSSDVTYNGVNAADVAVTNTDDDAGGITVTPTTGLTTTEAGGTATFTVVLTTQPTADVTIGLSSSDLTEGTVLPASLIFTAANWNVAQTVTVTGVDDALDDGNIAYTILTAAATSTDITYNGVNASDVTVTNTDNDAAGVTVTPTTGLTTTEAGGTATFTIVLNTQPTADVTIGLSSSNTAEGTVSPASVIFTSVSWNTAQTVTVTGVKDQIHDGNIVYTIVTAAATSTDPVYSGVNAGDVTVTNTDGDTASITVNPTTGLVTTEAGGTAAFTVVLTSQPVANVTIALSSSNPAEGTATPASITFTAATWNTPQTVTVTGVNDAVDDGDVAYTIVTSPATSTDPSYNATDASDVAATNTDDEATADLAVTNSDGVSVVTAGGSTTYILVVANAGPSAVAGATVTDTAPANVTFGTWTCVASSGSTCPATGSGNIAETVNLPAGGTATFTVPATISSAASGTVINTATASVPSGTLDPTPGNNSAVDTDSVTPAPLPTADLSVTKTNGTTLVSAGTTTIYTIVVTNTGPDGANNGILADPAAAGLTKTTVLCAAAGGATCPANPTVAQVEAGIAIPGLPFGGSLTFTIGATVTAVGGSVTNTATVIAPAGVTDPAPSNNSASDTDSAGTTVDISLTMTNGTSSVTAAGSTTYTIVVANAGTNAVEGVIVTVAATEGLQRTSLTCAASGGAACPSNPSVAQFATGLALPLLPPGGIVTLTLDTIVTAASGTVSTTAALTLPAGFTDTNPANNSATDTDSVTAAPIAADLAVTKSDGVTELLPGSLTTYTIAVTNHGPNAVTGATLTDTAPQGLTFGNWTCAATAGSSCAAGGAGNLSTAVSLLAGGTATFSVPATVAGDAPASISNAAIATVPSGVTDPVPANNRATDVDEAVPPQSLSVDVRAGEPTVVGPAAFDVPYSIEVRNTGPNPLTNLRVSDSLSAAFAQGAPTLTMAVPVTSSGPCVANSGFSGIGSESDPGTQLVSGTGSVGVGQSCTFALRVRLTYLNAAAIPTTAQTNRAKAHTSSRSGAIIATGEDADSVQLRLPRIDVTKMVTSVQQLGDEPVFDVGYAFVVRNTSEARAPNAQLTDDLAATFAPGTPRVTIVSGPSIEGGDASLTLAASYDGVAATSLLAGSDTMMPGTEQRVVLTVRVRYDSGSSIPVGVDLNNSAVASTSVAPGGTLIMSDPSTDVTESGEPPRADDEPSPTPVHLVPRPRLIVEKIANMFVAEIGDAVQYAVRVRNLGGPTLPEVSVTDRLPLGFRYIAGSARLGGSGTAQPLPDPAGGAGPVLTFAIPSQAASDEVTIIYRVRVGVGALQGDGINRADAVTGTVQSNMARVRVLVTGGVFTTDACIIGTVFADRNRNGVQDAGEPGVPDVHVNLEEGTSLVSDLEGKYSYCGLTPTTHVLHVDRTTLPEGSELTVSSNRNAGDAGSLFVDLKSGEVHRTDFIVDATADPNVLDEINIRRERVEIWAPSFDDPSRSTIIGGRSLAGNGATPRMGVVGLSMAPAPAQRIGGFEAIQQAGGLSPANSNAPEPLPAEIGRDTAIAPYTQGVLPLSTALRPMLAVGLLDGAVSFSRVTGGLLGPARPEAVFDRAFERFWRSFNGGQGQIGGRGALFVKGTVAEHYLLTLAYDSDKDERGVLFRDIQPDAFYPVYGDSSLKQFDAQTSGRVYARVDHGLDYVMYGDLQTSSFSPSVQQLGAYNRVMTGIQQHFENKRTMFNVFASHDSLRQVIDEFAALGISGPYAVSNPNGVSGTERVEIITRDRNQPALVLTTVPLTRFSDYEFEPFSGRLLFRRPVPGLDERLNPISIRVTYEVDAGAEKTWVGGATLQVRLGGALQMGGSWIEDSSPASPFRLGSVNTTLRLGRSSTIVIEGAQSTGTINTGLGGIPPSTAAGADPEGSAARVEWRHDSSRLIARAFAAITDPGFSNPASTLTSGRTEAGGRARLAIGDAVHINGEAIHSEDRLTDGQRDGGLLTVETKWRPLVFEAGVRRATGNSALGASAGSPLFGSQAPGGSFGFGSTNTSIDPLTGQPTAQAAFSPQLSAGGSAPATNTPLDVMTVRGKVTALFGKRANVYGEGEQDVRSADRQMAAVGTQFLISDRFKLYGRHEFISSLDGPYALTEGQRSYNTVFGASSSYVKDGDVFSEYRLADAISGREAEAAIGLRNQWTIAEGVRLHTGFERLHAIAGLEREATAASVGLEYLTSARFKSTGRLEWRNDSASDSWLSTAGFAQRLSRNWTMLARNYYQLTVPGGTPNQVQDRFSIGGAYRDTTTNRLNLLTRYEFRVEDTSGLAALAPGLSIGAATDRRVQIVSTHVDVHPLRAWTLSGQHAAKFVDDRAEASADRFGIHLVSDRVGYDLSQRWDLGALTSVMWGGDRGRRSALGGEVGFQLQKNLWFSTGYNVTGFVDPDLVSSNFTTRGVFVRLRMKFDESIVPGSAPDAR